MKILQGRLCAYHTFTAATVRLGTGVAKIWPDGSFYVPTVVLPHEGPSMSS